MQSSFRSNTRIVLPVEWAVLAYISLTAFLNLAFYNKVEGGASHLLVRLLILSIAGLLIGFQHHYPNRITNFLRYFYPLITLAYFYGETYYYNQLFFEYFDGLMMKLDQFIFGFQPSLEFSRVFPYPLFNELMNFAYFFYYLMIFGVCYAVYHYSPAHFQGSMFAVMLSFFIYYIIFILFPVMGPQYWFPAPLNQLPDAGVAREIVKFAQQVGENPTGAFPSSHVGMSVILCIISFRYVIKIFPLCLTLAVMLTLSAVYIKAHYAVDILGGIISAPLVYLLSMKVFTGLFKQSA